MARFGADAQARANGLILRASEEETDTLCNDVLNLRVDWPGTRAWFAARLEPFP
jgi:hypothetical protein